MTAVKTPLIGIGLALLVFFLDQASKHYVLTYVLAQEYMIEIAPFFNLALVWNYGISFGMLAGHRLPLLLIITSLVIVGILLVWLARNRSPMVALGLGATIGGAAGNIVDRIRFEAVVDFLDFHLGTLHWPAFNIADAGIFIGVVVLCMHSMFFEERTSP